MAWPAIDDLVHGWVARSYLKPYGWWLQLVLDEFAFLEPLGYSLATSGELKGVKFHQKGNYVWFEGPDRDVVVEYDPESGSITADVVDVADGVNPRFAPLDGLLAAHDAVPPPPRRPLNRAAVEATIRWWASGLRANFDAILGPASHDI